jgi:hypothetical protein
MEQSLRGASATPEAGSNIINPVVPKAPADATSTDTNTSK